MKRSQWFVLAGFFFILQFFLIWFQSIFLQPNTIIFSGEDLYRAAYYQLTKSAIISSMIILCMPFAILFSILGGLETKKK